jgi:hypothetical protein
MNFQALIECEGKDQWHEILSIDFEPKGGKIFVCVSHGPDECGLPFTCTGSILITGVKGFREKE